jgi:hypothetical protein
MGEKKSARLPDPVQPALRRIAEAQLENEEETNEQATVEDNNFARRWTSKARCQSVSMS